MDTAGQDEYSIMSAGYDGMDGYIIVYDVTNRKSFDVSPASSNVIVIIDSALKM